MKVQVDLGPEDLLDLAAGLDADRLDEPALPADDDRPVVVLLDEDRGPDVRQRPALAGLFPVVLFLPLDRLDIDRRHEGELLLHVFQDLLPDDLGQEEVLGLVRDLLVGVELLCGGQGFINEIFQDVEVDPPQGRDGDDILEGQQALVVVDDGQDRVFPDGVDLVDEQEDGRRHAPERLQDVLVPVAEFLGRVDEEADDVGRLEGGGDEIHHPLVEGVEGLVDPGVVDEDDLALPGRLDAQDADPGRLRLVGDDGDLLAHHGVEKGGFPGVGTADEGHGARLEDFLFRGPLPGRLGPRGLLRLVPDGRGFSRHGFPSAFLRLSGSSAS